MPRKATVRTRALRKCGMVAAARAFVESLAVGAGQHAGHGEYDGICSCTGISLRFIRLINRLPFARRLNPDPRHGAHGAPRYQTVVDMSSPTGYAGRSTRSARCSSSIRRSAASIGCADARSRPNRPSRTTTAPSRSPCIPVCCLTRGDCPINAYIAGKSPGIRAATGAARASHHPLPLADGSIFTRRSSVVRSTTSRMSARRGSHAPAGTGLAQWRSRRSW